VKSPDNSQSYPSVTSATSMLVEDILYGFYTSFTQVDEKDLDTFARKQLPYYSVPAEWRRVDSFPLTANGKVDKKELRTLAVCRTRADSGVEETSRATKEPSIQTTQTTWEVTESVLAPPKDVEKGLITFESKPAESTDSFEKSSMMEVPETLPPKKGYHGLRWLRHRAFILYRRFFSIIVLVNVAVACLLLYRKIKEKKDILADLSTATAANLCMAVLMRSEPVVNLLFTVLCSVPVSADLSRLAI
jgi:hypothetical protein